MDFKVKTTYTKDMVAELYRVASVTTQKKLNRFPEIFFRVGGIVLIVLGFILIFANGSMGQIIVAFAAGIFALSYHKVVQTLIINSMWKSAPKDMLENEFSFDEDGMTARDAKNTAEVSYDGIFRICETDDCYFVFQNKNQCNVLPKSGFTVGAPENFGDYISEKTGKNIEKITVKK